MKNYRSIFLAFIISTLSQPSFSDAVVTITDIKSWNHPVKKVLDENKVKISKVELKNNKKLPIFFVKFPYDPSSSQTKSYFDTLFFDVLNANGKWDYEFYDEDDELIISIHWDKATKTMAVDYQDINEK